MVLQVPLRSITPCRPRSHASSPPWTTWPWLETPSLAATSYQPRAVEGTVPHRVVREPFETFRAEIAACTDGSGLPPFVEREFREFLTCGVLSRGFARVRSRAGSDKTALRQLARL